MTGYGRMGSPGCCCLVGCVIYGDQFLSDTIGGNWTEVAGDWSIAAGNLSIDEIDALLIVDELHPDGGGAAQVVSVDVRLATAGDRARVILLYEDDDNYLFAEIWIDSNGCGHVSINARNDGENTELNEYVVPFAMNLDEWYAITICYLPGESIEPGTLTVKVDTIAPADPQSWIASTSTPGSLGGDQVGLGSGDPVAGTISFDKFNFQYYYDEEEHPDCPSCDNTLGCVLHSDAFERESLGCGWEEIEGDWSIDGGELTIDEEDAILRNRTQHPDNSAKVQLEFDFRTEAGVTVLAILDYTDDANFFYVKLEPGSHGDCGRVSFWRRTSGTDTQLGSDAVFLGMAAGETHSITICWKGELVKATLTPSGSSDYDDPSSHSVHPVEQESAEPYVGLGTGPGGGSSSAWFDNFVITRMGEFEEEECADCVAESCVLYAGDPRQGTPHTSFNCLWSIAAGSWSVNTPSSANAATMLVGDEQIEAGSNAMLLNESGHPGITGDGYLDLTSSARVYVVTFGFGDIVRLLIGVQDDNNYLYAEVEYSPDEDSVGYLRVGKVVGGTETELGETELTVEQGQPNADDDAYDHLGNIYQRGSELRVCYDGYEISAVWANGRGPNPPPPASVFGDADVGWNPGRSGLETKTVDSSVFFYAFTYHHDIFSDNGELTDTCVSCYEANVRCASCRSDDGEEDRTPLVLLFEIIGMDYYPFYASHLPYCDKISLYNDVFALPFRTSTGGVCKWQSYISVCPHVSDPRLSALRVELEHLGFSNFRLTGEIESSYANAQLPGSPTTATATWRNTFGPTGLIDHDSENNTFNCIGQWGDWMNLDDAPIFGDRTNWLGVATARVKIP